MIIAMQSLPCWPKNGIPADVEHAMVAKSGGKVDSPAAAAKRRKAPARCKMAMHSFTKRGAVKH
jgi:hypothetical protein